MSHVFMSPTLKSLHWWRTRESERGDSAPIARPCLGGPPHADVAKSTLFTESSPRQSSNASGACTERSFDVDDSAASEDPVCGGSAMKLGRRTSALPGSGTRTVVKVTIRWHRKMSVSLSFDECGISPTPNLRDRSLPGLWCNSSSLLTRSPNHAPQIVPQGPLRDSVPPKQMCWNQFCSSRKTSREQAPKRRELDLRLSSSQAVRIRSSPTLIRISLRTD